MYANELGEFITWCAKDSKKNLDITTFNGSELTLEKRGITKYPTLFIPPPLLTKDDSENHRMHYDVKLIYFLSHESSGYITWPYSYADDVGEDFNLMRKSMLTYYESILEVSDVKMEVSDKKYNKYDCSNVVITCKMVVYVD